MKRKKIGNFSVYLFSENFSVQMENVEQTSPLGASWVVRLPDSRFAMPIALVSPDSPHKVTGTAAGAL
jgi:hypothetical protein